MIEQNSIGREKAIEMAESKWWVGKSCVEIAHFQLHTEELCMDFTDFHAAVEKTIGRPVFTHEFSTNIEEIVSMVDKEFAKCQ